jgi:hypothetical protein
MNRFSAYLDNQKLARHWFNTARDRANGQGGRVKGVDLDGAVIALVNACEYQMTACNNIASLYFERRKKR